MTWENRIVGHGEEDPEQLLANPMNWRIHPRWQRAALRAVLEDVGVVSEVIVNTTTGHLLDGHLRVDLAIEDGQATIPVKYVQLTEDEEQEVLATLDPIGAMATADKDKLGDLMALLADREGAVKEALEQVARQTRLPRGEVKPAGESNLHNVPGELALTDEERELLAGKSLIKVAYSGGIDSSMALVWAVYNFGPGAVEACYVDLGVELPGMALHVKHVTDKLGCGLAILKPQLDFFVGLEDRGWPYWQGPWCQEELLNKTLDEHCRKFDLVCLLRVIGSNQKEQTRGGGRKNAKEQFKNMRGMDHYSPMLGWNKDQVREKLDEMGIPLWSGYSFGFPRTCCWMCPGGKPQHYAALRRTFPGLFGELCVWQQRATHYGDHPEWQKKGTLTFEQMADLGEKDLDAYLATESAAGRERPEGVSCPRG